ncbi:SAM-dependent methyltransferase [Rhodopirellula sp. MGV]|uniref:SAM-dependent methyltransferase n=1 Tax=Rhodopirellula sp. MGV TaxID=2023130 RepID=UPI000B9621E3|nr:methyltransferase domain-containing protein [Rhodopirellula sp. MGV]OYP37616.1 SAM-dependent methyltransferase [Rhodopirellula sp. MGV]PNY34935.1 methyltransferase domain-containing protein [Rhodopirellula baltica]
MSSSEQATTIARDYYNSTDADRFYASVWGGEDIHVGMYRDANEPIRDASHRTVRYLCERLSNLNANSRVLDIGSGYGGAARHLAQTYGCHVTCLNLSDVENERNRELNEQAGLTDQIDVLDGRFESVPCDDASFDILWSQDAILHSGDRQQVFQEVHRILRHTGLFVMTDPMKSDTCPQEVLQPILDRLHLSDLSSPATYQGYAAELGWIDRGFHQRTEDLVRHYSNVLRRTSELEPDLQQEISPEYITRMKRGLQYWIDGGSNGHLTWGVFLFEKP